MKMKDLVAPLTGVVFVVLVVAAVILLGDGEDPTKKSAQEIADFYSDNYGEQITGASLAALGSVFLLFFAGFLRKVLADAEGPGGILSTVAFGGAVVLAVAFTVGGTIHLALTDVADNIDPVAIQAINTIDYYLWFPFIVGAGVFVLASGISVVRHGALPAWLGWAAIVIGIASFVDPSGISLLVALAWVLVASVILALRSRSSGSPAAMG